MALCSCGKRQADPQLGGMCDVCFGKLYLGVTENKKPKVPKKKSKFNAFWNWLLGEEDIFPPH